jgi:His-Xaa-Ser system protein HxsD
MLDVITIAKDTASNTAIQKAIYRSSGELGLTVVSDAHGHRISSTRELSLIELNTLLRDINDYALREIIAEETRVYRDAILGAALIRVTSQQNEL